MTARLLALALTPFTAPLSLATTVALALIPNLDVTRTTDPVVARMRATAQEDN